MQPATKHIILLCDNNELAKLWLNLFGNLQSAIEIKAAASLQHLLLLIEQQAPDAIVLSVNSPASSYITYLKDLRKDDDMDKVPIFIYTALPAKEDVTELLRTISNN
jgi:CheY-like chemotaxis protein